MAEIDRENVIGSLEVRIISDTDAGYSTIEIPVNEAERILALLKEQEPKLLKPEEFAGSYDYVWVETRVSDNRSGLFVADICLASDAINYELQMCGQSDRPILEHSQLGKRWRCWDKKPTEAQMRAVKWE